MEIANMKHQCDYCSWYYEPRGCECPYQLRSDACGEAREAQAKDTINNLRY